jgi:hypothetical protein
MPAFAFSIRMARIPVRSGNWRAGRLPPRTSPRFGHRLRSLGGLCRCVACGSRKPVEQTLSVPRDCGHCVEMRRYMPYTNCVSCSARRGWLEGYLSWFSSCVRSVFLKPSIGRDMLLLSACGLRWQRRVERCGRWGHDGCYKEADGRVWERCGGCLDGWSERTVYVVFDSCVCVSVR